MKYQATITAKGDAEAVYAAFLPEKKDAKAERSEYTLRKEKDSVVFEVMAEDAVALRAMLNGISKMLSAIEKTREI